MPNALLQFPTIISTICENLLHPASLRETEMLKNHLLSLFEEASLSDPELWNMINQCLEEVDQRHPGSAEYLLPLITELMLSSKFEMDTENSRSVLMLSSVVLYSPFKSQVPAKELTDVQVQTFIRLLKKHYLNPNARVVVYPKFLTATEAATYAPDASLDLLKSMVASKDVIFEDPYKQLPHQMDPDPILQMEAFRQFGLYVRHILFTVSVPKTETLMAHPYSFVNPLSFIQTKNELGLPDPQVIEHLFDMPCTNPLWQEDMSALFAKQTDEFTAIFTEPANAMVADRDSEFAALCPRIRMLVQNACQLLHVAPSELCASISHYREPEEKKSDSMEVAEAEARVCLALKSMPEKPFTGDLITMFDGYFPPQLILPLITTEFMRQQVSPRLHMVPQDFAYAEDDRDLRLVKDESLPEGAPAFDQPLFLDFNGNSTTLFPLSEVAQETKHILYS